MPRNGVGLMTRLFRIFLIGALLAATGIDWYLVYLFTQTPTDYSRIRRFAGIAGGFLFTLVVLILVLLTLLAFTGAGFVILKKGLLSAGGLYAIFIFILLIAVAGINFAIMPAAKSLIDVPPREESEEYQNQRTYLLRLCIAAAGIGTALILIYILYFILRAVVNKED